MSPIAAPAILRGSVLSGGLALTVLAAYSLAWGAVRVSGGTPTQSSTWMAAAFIVAVTVPLVRPVLDSVADRLADRIGPGRYAAVNDFVERISDTLAVDDVLPQVAKTATQALRSSRAEVRLWFADGGEWSQTWPAGETDVPDAVGVSLRHEGMSVGRLNVDADVSQFGQADRDLLDRLAGPAGLALSNVRLTFQLRDELDQAVEIAEQLRRSRQRLLEAAAIQRRRFGDEVERRVLRPLDDADAALRAISAGDRGALVSAQLAVERALTSLRALAAGVFPAALIDSGITAALELHLQANFPLARLQVDGAAATSRHQPVIEASVYFCAVALISEIDPHDAFRVALTSSSTEPWLTLRLHGGRSPSPDTLMLVRDRAEAVDATVDFDRPPITIAFPATAQPATLENGVM